MFEGLMQSHAPDPDISDRPDHLRSGKTPGLGEGLGKSIREFKKAMKDGQGASSLVKKEEKKS